MRWVCSASPKACLAKSRADWLAGSSGLTRFSTFGPSEIACRCGMGKVEWGSRPSLPTVCGRATAKGLPSTFSSSTIRWDSTAGATSPALTTGAILMFQEAMLGLEPRASSERPPLPGTRFTCCVTSLLRISIRAIGFTSGASNSTLCSGISMIAQIFVFILFSKMVRFNSSSVINSGSVEIMMTLGICFFNKSKSNGGVSVVVAGGA
mmetsp:Transcript_26754/g.59048  ORF Transcript_26754/g.59048 Transcript_26754/m.59048 type:complete len:208 (-) Transcript_26754:400-1023(-)